jgi:hypothetical protein
VRWRSALTMAAILAATVTLTACDNPPVEVDAASLPLNPHPTHLVEVTGAVDPRLRVTIEAEYFSRSNSWSCVHHGFPIEGIDEQRQAKVVLPTHTDGGTVSALVQLDRYQPGGCRWQLATISALVEDSAGRRSKTYAALNDDYFSHTIHTYDQNHHLIVPIRDRNYNRAQLICRQDNGLSCTEPNRSPFPMYAFGPHAGDPVRIYPDTRSVSFKLDLASNSDRQPGQDTSSH